MNDQVQSGPQTHSAVSRMKVAGDSADGMDIVGIGVSVWDQVMLIDELPKSGSVVRALQRKQGIGGGVTIAIATAARLGSTTAMIDSLGDDADSNRIISALRDEAVETRWIAQQAGHTCSTASIWSEQSTSERTIVYSPGSAAELLVWSPQLKPIIASAKLLHLNGRHPEVCLQAIGHAKANGVLVSFDGGAYRYRDEILPLLRSADVVIVARQFAEAYFSFRISEHLPSETSVLASFLSSDLGCKIAAVTDGAQGSHVVQRGDDCFHQPAICPDRAVDTTGCGDTYHGAFLHALASGDDVRSAAELAANVSSENARSLGAMTFAAKDRHRGRKATSP